MNDLNQPPIPSPFEPPQANNNSSDHVFENKDWNNAPKIVRQWAYPLTWLAIIITPLALLALFIGEESANYALEIKLVGAFLYLLGWIISIWHNRALKRGQPLAWNAQIVSSTFGLCGFPLGTFISIYVLSQWFKPETKAWFGQN